MSTIIGFAGGGGIGFLLQQNINLLNYRAASTQMIAIAVVVGAMDYVSLGASAARAVRLAHGLRELGAARAVRLASGLCETRCCASGSYELAG